MTESKGDLVSGPLKFYLSVDCPTDHGSVARKTYIFEGSTHDLVIEGGPDGDPASPWRTFGLVGHDVPMVEDSEEVPAQWRPYREYFGPNAEHPTLESLVEVAAQSADAVAIRSSLPKAHLTKAIVRRTLEVLLANGMIRTTPRASWPEFLALDPPYKVQGGAQ